jgi:hypothetical protein
VKALDAMQALFPRLPAPVLNVAIRSLLRVRSLSLSLSLLPYLTIILISFDFRFVDGCWGGGAGGTDEGGAGAGRGSDATRIAFGGSNLRAGMRLRLDGRRREKSVEMISGEGLVGGQLLPAMELYEGESRVAEFRERERKEFLLKNINAILSRYGCGSGGCAATIVRLTGRCERSDPVRSFRLQDLLIRRELQRSGGVHYRQQVAADAAINTARDAALKAERGNLWQGVTRPAPSSPHGVAATGSRRRGAAGPPSSSSSSTAGAGAAKAVNKKKK